MRKRLNSVPICKRRRVGTSPEIFITKKNPVKPFEPTVHCTGMSWITVKTYIYEKKVCTIIESCEKTFQFILMVYFFVIGNVIVRFLIDVYRKYTNED